MKPRDICLFIESEYNAKSLLKKLIWSSQCWHLDCHYHCTLLHSEHCPRYTSLGLGLARVSTSALFPFFGWLCSTHLKTLTVKPKEALRGSLISPQQFSPWCKSQLVIQCLIMLFPISDFFTVQKAAPGSPRARHVIIVKIQFEY